MFALIIIFLNKMVHISKQYNVDFLVMMEACLVFKTFILSDYIGIVFYVFIYICICAN